MGTSTLIILLLRVIFNCTFLLYYNEKVRTKKIVNRFNLQVQTFQAKKNIMSISLFRRELLQFKNPYKKSGCQFLGFFTIYVCAYYFLTNNERAGRKEKFRNIFIFITLLFM